MNLPGVSVAVGVDGEIIWSEGFGWSDLSLKDPATPASLYPAGSISKSMTSVAAGILHDRGLLDLDAPVRRTSRTFRKRRRGPSTRGS
jgi:CubicO group peptidase (beta-lactamase class C family)